MPEPTMHMPRRWRDSDFGSRYYTEGWQDGLAGKDHAYLGNQAGGELVVREGAAALQAYTDGYNAGKAGRAE